VTPQHGQLSAYCSANGRVWANFYLFQRQSQQHQNAYYLFLPRSMCDSTLKRIQKYVLRSKVTLRVAQELALFALNGLDLEREVQALDNDASTGLSLIRLRAQQYLFSGEHAPLQSAWQHYAAHAQPAGITAWALLHIIAGVPWITPATAEAFVPQMINYSALGGLSFDKGCYSGQEIVARSHYLGSVKRHCYRLSMALYAEAGTAIKSAEDENAGIIINSAPHPSGGFVSLAVLKDAAAQIPLQCCNSAVYAVTPVS
jgi:tRNA-modifying protein YgfZ